MPETSSDRNPVEELAEEFVVRTGAANGRR